MRGPSPIRAIKRPVVGTVAPAIGSQGANVSPRVGEALTLDARIANRDLLSGHRVNGVPKGP